MPMSPKEMLTLLKENGFETVNQNGSHGSCCSVLPVYVLPLPYSFKICIYYT